MRLESKFRVLVIARDGRENEHTFALRPDVILRADDTWAWGVQPIVHTMVNKVIAYAMNEGRVFEEEGSWRVHPDDLERVKRAVGSDLSDFYKGVDTPFDQERRGVKFAPVFREPGEDEEQERRG